MIDSLATQLVQQAPDLQADTLAALRIELARIGTPLALSINRIVELIEMQLVDIAIALPPIAEACSVLETSSDPRVLDAMKYQIDTLQPVPDKPPAIGAPDVPINLVRRRRT